MPVVWSPSRPAVAQAAALEDFAQELIIDELDHPVASLAITEAGAGILPNPLSEIPSRSFPSKLCHPPGDKDHCIADIEIADLTAIIRGPSGAWPEKPGRLIWPRWETRTSPVLVMT